MEASVIIPAYNSASTIAECIRALKAQDFQKKDYEIIVVDDGSKDKTAFIAEKEGTKVLRQHNAGPAKARNNGAKFANGKILVFTDADCIAEKNWLQEMLKPFKDPKVIGVQGAYKTAQKSIVARFAQIEIEERYELMKKNAGCIDWVGSYSAAYRRGDFFSAGGFDESFPKASGEDPELSYKLAKAGKKLVFNPDAIVWHTHPDTLMKYLRTKFFRAFYRVKLYSKHKDKIAGDSYTTLDVKFQIIAVYFGTGLFLLSLPLYYFAYADYAFWAISASSAFTLLGFLSTLRLTFYAAKKDLWAGFYSIIAIALRNAVFSLGLLAGFVRQKVLK